MLGKLIDGVLITPSANERKKIVITNPTDKILKSVMGYKDLFYDDEPEYDIENQYLEQDIEETDTTITVHWIVKDIILEDIMIEDIQPSE
jgi:hypothetical protein